MSLTKKQRKDIYLRGAKKIDHLGISYVVLHIYPGLDEMLYFSKPHNFHIKATKQQAVTILLLCAEMCN